jgi:glutamine amidotransferase-like uncharacterized protein
VLILLCLTLTLNAVSAAANTTSTAGTTAQDKKVNTTTTTKTASTSTNYAAGSSTTIKVLIYSGPEAASDCVAGVKTSLATANSQNLVNGVKFNYATSTKITTSILSGYDLLVMPGGSGGGYYLKSSNIYGTAIKNFVKNGGGYLGICAGAYAAANFVHGYYNGWGIAPHVNAYAVGYTGNLPVTFTSDGTSVIKRSGTLTLHHYNGAAMYLRSSGAKIFAKYADSKSGYKGYAAIVGDYYGNGRVVLSGPHPELSPQYPDIIANLIVWATKTTVSTTPSTPTTQKATVSQIQTAAASVKTFYETNKRLPNYVTVNGAQLTMPKFMYLLATATIQLNSGSTSTITVKNVNAAPKISGSIKSGNIQKAEYITVAKRIVTFINTNGRAPNFLTTKLGTLSFTKAVYTFSKVLAFYKTNKRLPNFVAVSK